MGEDTMLGKEIGNYRIVNKVASGGFSTVYRAEHTFPQLKNYFVAIKILRNNPNSLEAQEMFIKEAQILLGLKHPYILPFIDVGPYEKNLYLMTDYAAGGSLRERISPPPQLLPWMQEVRTILSQIGQALQYIHEQKIIHCDLKPENILFNAQGEALLADFNIAKIAADVAMDRDKIVGRGTGTPAYMAPEQIRGKPTAQSDQYALSCMTYELLVGHRPFKGSQYEVLRQHNEVQPSTASRK